MKRPKSVSLESIWASLAPGFPDHAIHDQQTVISIALGGEPFESNWKEQKSPEFSVEFKTMAESILAFLGIVKFLIDWEEKPKTKFEPVEVKAAVLHLLIHHRVSHEKAEKIAADLTAQLQRGSSAK